MVVFVIKKTLNSFLNQLLKSKENICSLEN